jgi:Copper type II ascorbate-dependent monooxygenase, C-terminal domain
MTWSKLHFRSLASARPVAASRGCQSRCPAWFTCIALLALHAGCLDETIEMQRGPVLGAPDAALGVPLGDAGVLPAAAGADAAQASATDAARPAARALPCAIEAIVRAKCHSCHGPVPQGGAPVTLVSSDDFQQPAFSTRERKLYEVAAARLADERRPMPPVQAAALTAAERATLQAWLERGAPAESAACATPDAGPAPNDGGAGAAADGATDAGASADAAPAPAEETTCYELRAHGRSGQGDTSPYSIPPGESYACFYFEAPWLAPSVSVSFRSKRDNGAALHHWFLYAMPGAAEDGKVESCLPLHFDQPTMLAGWGPGGADFVLPPDVGEENPAPGSTLMVEWHYFNNSGAALQDRSSVEVCTVPVGKRPKTASVAWLGTEDLGGLFGMPAGTSSHSGVCRPGRRGLGASDPIHVLFTTPHMHEYGRRIGMQLSHADGRRESVLDVPFDDKNQTFLVTPFDVLPTDTITTTCSYDNTSGRNLGWGSPDGSGEMCYAFVLHYPAHALDNGAVSTLGAKNACW